MIGRILRRFGYAKEKALTLRDIWLSGGDLPPDLNYAFAPESAMRVATVMACVRVLAETIASLPLIVYRRLPDGGRAEYTKHPLYDKLYVRPNRQQTAFEWIEMLVGHLLLRGNAICEKIRQNGKLTDLIPVHPSRVRIEEYDNALIYRIRKKNGQEYPLLQDDVFHIRGMASDGYWGMGVIKNASETIKLARVSESYGISVFNSGGARRVLLKHPETLKEEAQARLRESWKQVCKNSAETAVLEEGMDVETVGMTAEDAQYLDVRKYQRTEICGLFRVPPHMVGDLERATFSNIDKQDLFFVKHTTRPWLKRIEQAITRDLIDNPDEVFVKFNVDALLRGDIKARTEACKIQFMHGARTIDEWRMFEGLNPIGGEFGSLHFVPVNLQPIERLNQEGASADDANNDEPPAGEAIALAPFIKDIARRIANYEAREIRKQRDFDHFISNRAAYIEAVLAPLAEVIGDENCLRELSAMLATTLSPDSDIDAEQRTEYIACALLAECESDLVEKLKWRVQAVAVQAHSD